MALKSNDFMSDLLKIVKDDDRLESNDLIVLEPEVSDGSSYDGFINFTDGFIDCKAEYTPKRDYCVSFSGGNNPRQKERAKNAQLILDNLCRHNFKDFFDYYIEDAKEGDALYKFKNEFETAEDFKKWFENYMPNQFDETPSLFTGKNDIKKDPKHDWLYDYFLEVDDEEFYESPAFVGVRVMLYDTENWRGGHKRMAKVDSYFNDDLSYGREHVGSWARLMGMTSADGSDIGNHYIFTSEFQYTTLNDLKRKLKPRVQKAYDSLGL